MAMFIDVGYNYETGYEFFEFTIYQVRESLNKTKYYGQSKLSETVVQDYEEMMGINEEGNTRSIEWYLAFMKWWLTDGHSKYDYTHGDFHYYCYLVTGDDS